VKRVRFLGDSLKRLQGFPREATLDLGYQITYTARLADAVYVLHAFQKKTQATSKQDIEIARIRFATLTRSKQ
jgi:phage-related protein